TRVSALLLANRASILRELIRTVMAVEIEPASKRFEAIGFDPAKIPAILNVPSGSSWHRLISWVLSLGGTVSIAAMLDVVACYTAWAIGTLGLDPLTPLLVHRLCRWLTEIEAGAAPQPSETEVSRSVARSTMTGSDRWSPISVPAFSCFVIGHLTLPKSTCDRWDSGGTAKIQCAAS